MQSLNLAENLAAKFELGTGPAKFYLACQVFWSQYVFHEFLPRCLPSLNLAANFAAKLKLGSQVQTLQPSFKVEKLAKVTNRACF
jgi:hypothetical protein